MSIYLTLIFQFCQKVLIAQINLIVEFEGEFPLGINVFSKMKILVAVNVLNLNQFYHHYH
mgnify:CR=1 FL=1